MANSKKAVSLLLAVLMALSLAVCGGAAEGASADGPAWKNNTDDDTKLTWYINLSWINEQWGSDWTSAYITEKTGFNIEVSAPIGSEGDKLNTMIASGNLPDIMTLGWWESQFTELEAAGYLLALNELADQYDPYFYEVANPDILNWNRRADGNVYAYNCYTTTPSDFASSDEIYSNETFVVRKDMYEAIGSPDMSTPEGFLQALRDAKAMFPDVNGVPIHPFGLGTAFPTSGAGSLGGYLQDFLAIPYEVDGKLYDRDSDPEYVRWLKVLRQAYSEGLISSEMFTDKEEQIGDKIVQGRYFALLKQWSDMQEQQRLRYDQDPEGIYISVGGPANSKGDDPTLPAGSINGWLVNTITSNCKNPQRAIEFFTYMLSPEGLQDIYLGVPGETCEEVDGRMVLSEAYMEKYNANPDEWYPKTGVPNLWGYFTDNQTVNKYAPPTYDYIKAIRDWTAPYAFYAGQYDIPEFDPDSSEGVNHQRIKNLMATTLPKLITAASEEEFDAIFSDFLERRAGYDFENIMNLRTVLMRENKVKLGL